MAKIKIKDIPKDQKISKEEMRKVLGGFNPQPEPPARFGYSTQLNPYGASGVPGISFTWK